MFDVSPLVFYFPGVVLIFGMLGFGFGLRCGLYVGYWADLTICGDSVGLLELVLLLGLEMCPSPPNLADDAVWGSGFIMRLVCGEPGPGWEESNCCCDGIDSRPCCREGGRAPLISFKEKWFGPWFKMDGVFNGTDRGLNTLGLGWEPKTGVCDDGSLSPMETCPGTEVVACCCWGCCCCELPPILIPTPPFTPLLRPKLPVTLIVPIDTGACVAQ